MYVYLFVLLTIVAAEDYYKLLEVSPEASDNDIKKAFRKLSVTYHPDKNPGDKQATKRFQDINKAYEILTDPEKRMIYDFYGEEALTNPQNYNRQKGPNAQAEIHVTLEELYNGTDREFTLQKKVLCKQCKGTGSKDGTLKICKHCNGRGQRMQNVNMGIGFTVQMQTACDRCGGRGKISSGNCSNCRGNRVQQTSKTLQIEVERGMTDGQTIVFRGESEQSPDYFPGDVIFYLRQMKHPLFERRGNDLYMDMEITLKEAILGFKKRVKHLDNHYVEVESNKIIQPFEVKQIAQEGMPIHQLPSVKGDLYIKFIVKMPAKLSEQEKEFIRKIFA
ncbi:unnamed protein product (macronuclear) [Paramecium tetraurelia]|uniref:Uncharacterized protein n=1 Tax=Paramecium tetraurelia TaxID=5888 RepID=A0CRV1_PARTE|nr:uncharacterized protein GSPATT00009833001 [Paramecium tetraurelia]CAK73518.1 unnamed protein product [Paramecium tetraurelia]|eukprot:XP_001440915.1 hypothetical protein (macronuclear) [Paramecium tetraurelia strain d4-2]